MSQEITIKKSTYNKILVGFFVLAVAFSFSAGFILGGSGKATTATGNVVVRETPPAEAPSQPSQPTEPSRVQVSADDDPVLGSADAKVTVIEFSDFQCPFCGRFYDQSEVPMKSEYINTGKVKFVYRDFPLESIHPEALPGAMAAECAKEQGKFWEFHDKIFQNQESMSSATYKQWAKELGLDETQFNNCFDSRKYESEVKKDFDDGVNAGVSGTPTIFIGTPQKGYVKIVGAQPYSVIKQIIDQELAA